jgi:hypothetical protein
LAFQAEKAGSNSDSSRFSIEHFLVGRFVLVGVARIVPAALLALPVVARRVSLVFRVDHEV